MVLWSTSSVPSPLMQSVVTELALLSVHVFPVKREGWVVGETVQLTSQLEPLDAKLKFSTSVPCVASEVTASDPPEPKVMCPPCALRKIPLVAVTAVVHVAGEPDGHEALGISTVSPSA